MKLKKRLGALLAALCLLCSLVLPLASGAAPTVYLLAVGNKMFDPAGGALPVSVDGVIYIPYTVFDRNTTGWDLGVYYGIDQSRGPVLTLYSSDKRLIFTVNMGICEDQDGNSMSFRARIRNNIPYVPASAVCSFFGLNYSFLPTSDRGTLIRIADEAATSSMSDSFFMSAAQGAMLSRYNDIVQSQDPQLTPSPSPSTPPVETPPPSAPPSGSGKEKVRLYLAVDASEASSDLTLLFPAGVKALFLFTPDSLPTQAKLVRKAVAAGHSVGLLVSGTAEEALAQLEQGNELLAHIARVKTRLVSAPGSLTAALSAEGWSCWQSNVAGDNAATLLANLDLRRTVGRITLPASSYTISRVLSRVREDGYDIRQPLETDI